MRSYWALLSANLEREKGFLVFTLTISFCELATVWGVARSSQRRKHRGRGGEEGAFHHEERKDKRRTTGVTADSREEFHHGGAEDTEGEKGEKKI